MSDNEAIRMEEASGWVARMDRESWSGEDEAALQDWLRADEKNRGALLYSQAVWLSLESAGVENTDQQQNRSPVLTRRRAVGALAFASIGSLAGIGYWGQDKAYRTDTGEIRRVALDDGSVATINTESRVLVRMGNHRRTIALDQGEAWFEVAKDPLRPFVVESGTARALAVGTAFSVRRSGDATDIVVTEGIVQVWPKDADVEPLLLKAGESARVTRATVHRAKADPERSLAWRTGSIFLRGDTVASAAAEFNRYNRRQIILLDQDLAQEQLDGVFSVNDPEAFAALVRDSFSVPVDMSRRDRIEMGSGMPRSPRE